MDALMALTIIGRFSARTLRLTTKEFCGKETPLSARSIRERIPCLTATLAKGSLKTVAWTVPEVRAESRLGFATELQHGDLFRIAAELFNSQLGRVVGSRTEAANRKLFAVQVGAGLDLWTNDELEGKKIDAPGDNCRIASLKIGGDRKSACGKNHLQLVGQKRLHADGSAL